MVIFTQPTRLGAEIIPEHFLFGKVPILRSDVLSRNIYG